jgi:3-polyprenyl-4-hydroxybenzoate decarboxylase
MLDPVTSKIALGSNLSTDATEKLPGESFKRLWLALIKMDEAVMAKVGKLFTP